MDDGRVISPAELLADLGQGEFGELAAEIHRDLAGVDEHARTGGAAQVIDRQAEIHGRLRHDRRRGDGARLRVGHEVFEDDLGEH